MSLTRLLLLLIFVGLALYVLDRTGIVEIGKATGKVTSDAKTQSDPYRDGDTAFLSLRWDDALRHYTRALREKPNDAKAAVAQFRVARCLEDMKQQRDALEAYRLYLKRFPDDAADRTQVARRQVEFLAAQLGVK